MRPFEKKPGELRIPWTTQVKNGVNMLSDVKRNLMGSKAMPPKTGMPDKGPTPDRLVDKERTLLGSLKRKPADGTTFIPDDRKRKWKT